MRSTSSSTAASSLLGLTSVVVFLFLIDYAARMLRPVSIVANVGGLGLRVIRSVYPASTGRLHRKEAAAQREHPARTVANAGSSGVVLAVRIEQLVLLARDAEGLIEVIPASGRLPGHGRAPVSSVRWRQRHQGCRPASNGGTRCRANDRAQDASFAFRESWWTSRSRHFPRPSNRPTTAVLAIDQLHRLLRRVGMQDLRSERVVDTQGSARVIFHTPNWEDYVHLACTEIRHCGVGGIPVPGAACRAMLENLMQTLPPHRPSELIQQVDTRSRRGGLLHGTGRPCACAHR